MKPAVIHPWPHGTATGYDHDRCECGPCGEAKRFDRTRRQGQGLAPGDRRHGTPNGYTNWGCRCTSCTEANRQARRAYRARRATAYAAEADQ